MQHEVDRTISKRGCSDQGDQLGASIVRRLMDDVEQLRVELTAQRIGFA
jgi:hypothetical protein